MSRRLACWAAIVALTVMPRAWAAAGEKPASAATPSNDDCLACHSSAQDRTHGPATRAVGDDLSKSIHGPLDLACVDCHADPAAAEVPHPERLAAPTCDQCHEEAVTGYDRSVHAESRRTMPDHQAAACWDCHGKHDMLGVQDPNAPVSHFKLTATCARCHDDPKVVAKAKIRAGQVPTMFRDSIHGQALDRSGLVVAPNCANCHGNHDIRRADDKDSRVNRRRVPDTCGACHQGIKAAYGKSAHAGQLAKGNPKSPECATCHTAHQVQPVTSAWRLSVVGECGTCHPESLRTFHGSFHGKASRLGFDRAATCGACHGSHAILATHDPGSSVAPGHIVQTCRRCHAKSSANLALFDPHADPSNPSRNAALFYVSWGMRIVLLVVLGFFGLHTLLWTILRGGARANLGEASLPEQDNPRTADGERPTLPVPSPVPASPTRDHVLRFAPRDRWLHLLLMASFLLLSLTGILLLFAEAPWVGEIARLVGGYRITSKLHRLGALMLGLCAFLHVGRLLRRGLVGREFGLLGGRDSMVPGPRDLVDLHRHLAWFVGLGPRPGFERYTYWEKFDYWAVFWGLTVVGLSGLMLWTPDTFTRFLPGWVYNIALVVHGEEALLIMVFIFTVHFFNRHLRADKYPMDTVIFTGCVSLEELKRERPGEYQRLEAEGRLQALMVEAPPPDQVRSGQIIGGIAVALGLAIAGFALWALLQ